MIRYLYSVDVVKKKISRFPNPFSEDKLIGLERYFGWKKKLSSVRISGIQYEDACVCAEERSKSVYP